MVSYRDNDRPVARNSSTVYFFVTTYLETGFTFQIQLVFVVVILVVVVVVVVVLFLDNGDHVVVGRGTGAGRTAPVRADVRVMTRRRGRDSLRALRQTVGVPRPVPVRVHRRDLFVFYQNFIL